MDPFDLQSQKIRVHEQVEGVIKHFSRSGDFFYIIDSTKSMTKIKLNRVSQVESKEIISLQQVSSSLFEGD